MYSSVCDVIVNEMEDIVGKARKDMVHFPSLVSFLNLIANSKIIGSDEMITALLLVENIFKKLSSSQSAVLPDLAMKTSGDDLDELICVIAVLLTYKVFTAPDDNPLDNKTFWAAYNTTLRPGHELYYDVDVKRSEEDAMVEQSARLNIFNAYEFATLQRMDFTVSVSPDAFEAMRKTVGEKVEKAFQAMPSTPPSVRAMKSPPINVPLRASSLPTDAVNDDERWSAGSALDWVFQGNTVLFDYAGASLSRSSSTRSARGSIK